LIQLRSIAKPFDGFTHREQIRSLILFPQPLYKYQDPDSGILAGAVFGLFDGRDAEIILMIEARQNGDQRQWAYAAVPFSEGELSMRYDGKEIWSATARGYSDSTQAFYSPRPAQHDPALEDFKFESLDEESVEAGVIDVEDKRDP
jgi:hypothetical protein